MELADLPGDTDSQIEIYRCRRCNQVRSCARGWTTRCHLCPDERTHIADLARSESLLIGRDATPANRRAFAGFRDGLSHTSDTLIDAVAFLNSLVVAEESRLFQRAGWTVQAMDLYGMPWIGNREKTRSHGTWGTHDECGTLQLLKPQERRLECVSCPPPPGSRSARARRDEPYLLYLVRHGRLAKFGVGDDRRIRAHVRGGAEVVQVLQARFSDVCRAELDLKRYHRDARHLVAPSPDAPVTFGTGTEVVPDFVPVALDEALGGRGTDVTERFRPRR